MYHLTILSLTIINKDNNNNNNKDDTKLLKVNILFIYYLLLEY
jgi:hypothetical protein